MKISRAIIYGVSLLLCVTATAGNWPQWRGPNFNGSSDETALPSTWTRESATWGVALPGPSAATPVIWGDRVFVPGVDTVAKKLHAMCLDRKTGKTLWDRQVGEGLVEHDEKSNFASPSPVADGERVYFFYGSGMLAAFDHEGKELWTRSITKDYGDFAFNWTFSSSPTLYGGKLYLQVLERNVPVHGHGKTDGPIESFLLALEPATGKALWRVTRPSDAVAESREAYTTPIPFEQAGQREILIAGGDCLTGHDPESGKELWRSASFNARKASNWRLVPSPVAGGGIILACMPQRNPVYAVRAGGSGQLTETAIAWNSEERREISSDVPTPLFYDGDFFLLSDVQKKLFRIEPVTGNVKWVLPLPGSKKFEASPTGADGKIYLINFAGDVVVVDPVKGGITGTIPMGDEGDDMTRSAIAVADGALFIRTNHKLYCVGKTSK